jgi:hypothetical protein
MVETLTIRELFSAFVLITRVLLRLSGKGQDRVVSLSKREVS